jgi:phosphoglycerol transferase
MKVKTIISYLLIFLSFVLFYFTEWLQRYFGKVNFEQILIFIDFGTSGLLNSEEYVIKKFIQLCFYLPLIVVILLIFLNRFLKKYFDKNKFLTFISNSSFKISFLFFIVSFIYFFNQLSIQEKFKNHKNSNFIAENYSPPKLIKIPENKKKDLVVIYLESFQENFLSLNGLDEKTVDKLNFTKIENYKVKNFYETPYNNFTIGAIVSSQCGIPQKPIGILDPRFNKRTGNHTVDVFGLKKFLPNAICVGDILKFNNYESIFINSGNSNFQAMDIFFKNHGYDKILGKKYFIDKKYDNFNSWANGVNDSSLFIETEKIIDQLRLKNKKFNISLLTTDTHYPGNYIDNNCVKKNQNLEPDLNFTITCTAKYLYRFVKNLKYKYKDSVKVIIIGDHSYPSKILNNTKIYNRFINSNLNIYRDEMNHFDIFPTILDLMSIPYKKKAGLGYSIMRKNNELNYTAYKKLLMNNLEKKSDFYYEFWK